MLGVLRPRRKPQPEGSARQECRHTHTSAPPLRRPGKNSPTLGTTTSSPQRMARNRRVRDIAGISEGQLRVDLRTPAVVGESPYALALAAMVAARRRSRWERHDHRMVEISPARRRRAPCSSCLDLSCAFCEHSRACEILAIPGRCSEMVIAQHVAARCGRERPEDPHGSKIFGLDQLLEVGAATVRTLTIESPGRARRPPASVWTVVAVMGGQPLCGQRSTGLRASVRAVRRG